MPTEGNMFFEFSCAKIAQQVAQYGLTTDHVVDAAVEAFPLFTKSDLFSVLDNLDYSVATDLIDALIERDLFDGCEDLLLRASLVANLVWSPKEAAKQWTLGQASTILYILKTYKGPKATTELLTSLLEELTVAERTECLQLLLE